MECHVRLGDGLRGDLGTSLNNGRSVTRASGTRLPSTVERDGEEIARFVEEEPVPIAVYLGRELEELAASV